MVRAHGAGADPGGIDVLPTPAFPARQADPVVICGDGGLFLALSVLSLPGRAEGQVIIRDKHGELVGWTAFGHTRTKDGALPGE